MPSASPWRGVRRAVPGIHQWLLDTYGSAATRSPRPSTGSPHEPTGPYQWTPTPPSMQHKYVTEDVPCGLVAMSARAAAAGAATPVIDGLIALSGTMLGRDFANEGRNLEHGALPAKPWARSARSWTGPTG